MKFTGKLIALAACGLFSAGLVGCGGGVREEKLVVQTSAIEANVRKTLESYEKTGKMGSSMTSLQSDINGIKTSDSAKGEALAKDYRELQTLKEPAKIKAKAKEMLGKL